MYLVVHIATTESTHFAENLQSDTWLATHCTSHSSPFDRGWILCSSRGAITLNVFTGDIFSTMMFSMPEVINLNIL